jgi:hypothetical protein
VIGIYLHKRDFKVAIFHPYVHGFVRNRLPFTSEPAFIVLHYTFTDTRCPGRDNSIILFPDFYGLQIAGGTYCLTGAAAVAFFGINAWK